MADNKAIVRAIEEAWDRGDVDALDQYFAPDFAQHSAIPSMPPGLQGAKLAHQGSMAAFPDRHVEIEEIYSEGDAVTVRCRMTGTNQGGMPWLGVPANGNPIDIEWISIYRLHDGRVVAHRAVMDMVTLMTQLGALPAPAGATQ